MSERSFVEAKAIGAGMMEGTRIWFNRKERDLYLGDFLAYRARKNCEANASGSKLG